jgi:hypothetical protein
MHRDPISKRQQKALRFFTYGVMTIAVVVISLICILFVLGYRFDQSNGRIEQQALLQLRSFPSNATLVLDGKQLPFRTPGKRTVAAGQHSVVMELDGYRKWSKQATLRSGSLLWLNYARLIPSSITTDEIRELGKLTDVAASPDRHWLALSTVVSGKPQLTIGDISNEEEPKFSTLEIPNAIMRLKNAKPGMLALDEWDLGGRYLLARHTVAGKTDFLQIDRTDPTETRNITRQLKISITKAHFVGTNGTTLFVLSSGDIRKIDLAAGTISRPLVSGVKDFTLYKSDTIAFSAIEGKNQVAGVYKDGDKEPTIVRTYKGLTPEIKVSVSNYFSDDYQAIAHGKSVEVIKNPTKFAALTAPSFKKFTAGSDAQWCNFSSNGRFVLVQNSNTFTSYDLEEDVVAKATVGAVATPHRLQWIDDYMLASDAGGTLRFSEFDGMNQQIITDVAPGFELTLSENGEQLFTIGKNAQGAFMLQRSRMVLGN